MGVNAGISRSYRCHQCHERGSSWRIRRHIVTIWSYLPSDLFRFHKPSYRTARARDPPYGRAWTGTIRAIWKLEDRRRAFMKKDTNKPAGCSRMRRCEILTYYVETSKVCFSVGKEKWQHQTWCCHSHLRHQIHFYSKFLWHYSHTVFSRLSWLRCLIHWPTVFFPHA